MSVGECLPIPPSLTIPFPAIVRIVFSTACTLIPNDSRILRMDRDPPSLPPSPCPSPPSFASVPPPPALSSLTIRESSGWLEVGQRAFLLLAGLCEGGREGWREGRREGGTEGRVSVRDSRILRMERGWAASISASSRPGREGGREGGV